MPLYFLPHSSVARTVLLQQTVIPPICPVSFIFNFYCSNFAKFDWLDFLILFLELACRSNVFRSGWWINSNFLIFLFWLELFYLLSYFLFSSIQVCNRNSNCWIFFAFLFTVIWKTLKSDRATNNISCIMWILMTYSLKLNS